MTALIDLTKKAKVVLEKKQIFGEKAQVVFALDISGSMSSLFNNGTVQELTDRLLGIGMNLDDNQSIDVFAFGMGNHEIGTATEKNYSNFVNGTILKKVNLEYDTKYAGVMDRIANKFSMPKKGLFKKTVQAAKTPTYVIFVTDGNNSDPAEAERIIRETSDQAIFWQFVGIGNASFSFLQKLDDMSGRFLDNADFFSVSNLRQVSDEELYEKLLNEFPTWLNQARAKGILEM